MEELKIPSDKNSPDVVLRPEGMIKISGRSIHENIIKFYEPVNDWVEEYCKNPADVTCVDMNFEYLNSASAKALLNVLDKVARVSLINKRYIFNWYYEEGDEDILERGEYFSSILNVPFNFIKIKTGHKK